VAEWQQGAVRVKGLIMNVGENDYGNGYDYYAIGVDITTRTALGRAITGSTWWPPVTTSPMIPGLAAFCG
jgi:hypothetical protein